MSKLKAGEWRVAEFTNGWANRLLPDLLRQMRQEAGLTQRDLSGKLRVSHVSVHKSETGQRRVDVAEFMDWCLACDRNPEEAFHRLREARGLRLGSGKRA